MSILGIDSWLKKPADHAIIERWTVKSGSHTLELPQPPYPHEFTFLVLGDSGDSESHGSGLSPQDAIAQSMSAECGLTNPKSTIQNPKSADSQLSTLIPQPSTLVLHTGDLVYMTGEKRLYDRNFRRPYTDFLTPESTVDNLVFRIPFLPVPGNHDYYDLGSWAMWLTRIPFVGAGLRALTRQLFAFSMPEGGSQMGKAYMNAFVDLEADTAAGPLPYRPGERTRLPNRYYRFTVGSVDFFALDSNTLDAPSPGHDAGQIRAEAANRAEALEAQARKLDSELRRIQSRCDKLHDVRRTELASDTAARAALIPLAESLYSALINLLNALKTQSTLQNPESLGSVHDAAGSWSSGLQGLNEANSFEESASALEDLDAASEQVSESLRSVESRLGKLPESVERSLILSARDQVEQAQEGWSEAVQPLPQEYCDRLRTLSEEALDVQRELALEKRLARYTPDDHDSAQLRWLAESLEESRRNRPDNWRVVYLHHPLYSTIVNHCERPDVVDVRENLLDILKDSVHLVLSGHSHAFEWFRSDRLPNVGLFVTGGGGQVSLRPSILSPRRLARYRHRYDAMRRAGVVECAFAGYGPIAPDGQSGPLYHYLRVEVAENTLKVTPVGIRAISGGYRHEQPIPVHHARTTGPRPILATPLLDSITIHRASAPTLNT